MNIYTNCTEVRDDFSALLDNELSPEDSEAIELHLSDCSDCLRALEAMKQVVDLYNDLPAQSAPDNFTEGIHQALDEDAIAFSRSERSSQRVSYRPVFLAAATLALMAGVSFIAMQGLNGNDTQYAEAPEASMDTAALQEVASEESLADATQQEEAYWGNEIKEETTAKKSRPEFIEGTPEYEKRIELTLKSREAMGPRNEEPKPFSINITGVGNPEPQDTTAEGEASNEQYNSPLAELIRSQFTVQEDGLWIQTGYTDQPLTVLEPGTQDYLNLLFRVPNLQNLVRHTRDIIFLHEGKWYRIAHEGPLLPDRVLGYPHPNSRKRTEDIAPGN